MTLAGIITALIAITQTSSPAAAIAAGAQSLHVDWSISVGNLITAGGLFCAGMATAARWHAASMKRTASFESLIGQHAETLVKHSTRMEQQDKLLTQIMGDVQRLVGRMEANHAMDLAHAADKAVRVIEDAAAVAAQKILHTAREVERDQSGGTAATS